MMMLEQIAFLKVPSSSVFIFLYPHTCSCGGHTRCVVIIINFHCYDFKKWLLLTVQTTLLTTGRRKNSMALTHY